MSRMHHCPLSRIVQITQRRPFAPAPGHAIRTVRSWPGTQSSNTDRRRRLLDVLAERRRLCHGHGEQETAEKDGCAFHRTDSSLRVAGTARVPGAQPRRTATSRLHACPVRNHQDACALLRGVSRLTAELCFRMADLALATGPIPILAVSRREIEQFFSSCAGISNERWPTGETCEHPPRRALPR